MPHDFLRARLCGAALVALFTGCGEEPIQSTLDPAGPAAAEIAWLWWIMLGAFTAVFVLVLVLLGDALFRRPRGPVQPEDDEPTAGGFGRNAYIVLGGIVLPIVTLTPLYFLSLQASSALGIPRDALTIRVVGRMWWWEVHYPEQGIVTANEIHIPAGKPVRLELASADVVHSFWVPRLHGKRDLIPGKENEFSIQADRPGIYRGQCGEYCGTQHANMAFEVIALPQEEFDAWLAERARPRPELATDEQRRGLSVFLRNGCPQCHAVRGTAATSNAGPDLSHLGRRRMIGAAMLPNTRGNLAGWIANPQAIKPGIKMPRTYLSADDSAALLTYLESLQ